MYKKGPLQELSLGTSIVALYLGGKFPVPYIPKDCENLSSLHYVVWITASTFMFCSPRRTCLFSTQEEFRVHEETIEIPS